MKSKFNTLLITCNNQKQHEIYMADCPAQKFYEGNLVDPEEIMLHKGISSNFFYLSDEVFIK